MHSLIQRVQSQSHGLEMKDEHEMQWDEEKKNHHKVLRYVFSKFKNNVIDVHPENAQNMHSV